MKIRVSSKWARQYGRALKAVRREGYPNPHTAALMRLCWKVLSRFEPDRLKQLVEALRARSEISNVQVHPGDRITYTITLPGIITDRVVNCALPGIIADRVANCAL